MSNDLSILNMGLPAHLQALAKAANSVTEAAGGGVKTAFTRISYKGSVFRIVRGEDEIPIEDRYIDVVIVGANPRVSRTFYLKDWEAGDDGAPNCASDDGITPNAGVTDPQAQYCASCPQSVWGSKTSKASGKGIKACSDTKRLALLAQDDLHGDLALLSIPPASLEGLATYINMLRARNVPIVAIVTRVGFDINVSFPKLTFTPQRYLTEEEMRQAIERASDPLLPTIVGTLPRPEAAAAPYPSAPVVAPVVTPQAPPVAAPTARKGFGAAATAPAQTAVVAPAAPRKGFGGAKATTAATPAPAASNPLAGGSDEVLPTAPTGSPLEAKVANILAGFDD